MRVAVWVKKFPPQYETFIVNQISGLVERRCDVQIFAACTGRRSGEPVYSAETGHLLAEKHENALERSLDGKVHIRPSIPQRRLARLCKTGGMLARYGFTSPRLWRVFSPPSGGPSRLLFEAVPFLRRRRHDVIHCQYGPLGVLGVQLRMRGLLTGKIVTAFRGYDIGLAENDDHGHYRRLFAEGDLFLPVCDDLRRRLIRCGCDERKIHVHRSGIDLQKIQRAAPTSFSGTVPLSGLAPSPAPTMVTVGRLVEKKGIEGALRAAARIKAKFEACPKLRGAGLRYLIIGDGPLRARLERFSHQLGLRDVVEFAGWRSHDWVIQRVAQSRVMVLPSVAIHSPGKGVTREGVPNVLKEAMALGLPIVATRHAGIPELVEHGKTGLLAPEHDIDQLANHLETLLTNPQLGEKMGAAGRLHVEEHYNTEVLNDRLVEIYRRLLDCKTTCHQ